MWRCQALVPHPFNADESELMVAPSTPPARLRRWHRSALQR